MAPAHRDALLVLMQQGLTESLAGRFKVLHLPHWSYTEIHAAFGFSLEDYLYFAFKPKRTLIVGGNGIALEEFLTRPVEHWLQA